MKYCAKCNNSYNDDTLAFCLECGSPLVPGGSFSNAKTEVMNQPVTANVQSKPTAAGQNIYTQQPISSPQYPSDTGAVAAKSSKAGMILAFICIMLTLGGFLFFIIALTAIGLGADEQIAGVIIFIGSMIIPAIATLFGLAGLYRAFRSRDGKGAKKTAILAIIINLIYVVGFIALMLLGAINNYMEGKYS